MKTKGLVVAAVMFAVAGSADAEPVQPKVQPVMAKAKTELSLANASAVPGEKKTFDVLLADGAGKPLAGKTVQLGIGPKAGGPALSKHVWVGQVTTNASGHALFPWATEDLKQGNFELEASYAGDATTLPSNGTANLLVVKAMATFTLEKMTWGTYKDEPGEPGGSIIITLIRTSDQKYLSKPFTISVNGFTWQVNSDNCQIGLTPKTAKSWDVKVQFDGDDYTQSSAGERVYQHP